MQFSDTTVRSQRSEKRKVSDQFKFYNDTTKVSAFMDYRKAKSLCYKCGLKWGPTHKCISTIPLHVVEELWQVLDPYVTTKATSHIQDDSGDDLMILSVHALQGTEALQTMKLLASLGNKTLVKLMDSRSSSSFYLCSASYGWSNSRSFNSTSICQSCKWANNGMYSQDTSVQNHHSGSYLLD